jgi:hypothetical protein
MMKPFRLLVPVLLLTAVPLASGQVGRISSERDLIDFMHSDLNYLENQRERYASIDGSPYLDESFREGSLSFRGTRYDGLALRLNVYEGYFEFETDEGVKYFDPAETPADTVWMGGDTYLQVYYRSGRNLKRSYMKLLNAGSTAVLRESVIILADPQPAQGYDEAKPARFEPRPDKLFIRVEGNTAQEFKGKNSLEEIFPDHLEELAGFVKAEKLKLKKEEEIIRLCTYYDSIR